MANGKVAGYRLELRMAIADGLINGRDFDEIREYLRGAGLVEADFPSDHSIRTFQESVEYDMMYRRRVEAVELRMTAGSLAGVAAARVEILQNQALEKLGRWMDAGLVESTDIFKALAFTLQFQRQALAGRKLRSDLGETELPEALGPKMISKAHFDAFIAQQVEANAAAPPAYADDAEDADTYEEMDDDERSARILEDLGYPRLPTDDDESDSIAEDTAGSARIVEDATAVAADAAGGARQDRVGSARIVEEDGGYARIAQDSADTNTDTAAGSARQDGAGSARIVEEDGGYARIAQDLHPAAQVSAGTDADAADAATATAVADATVADGSGTRTRSVAPAASSPTVAGGARQDRAGSTRIVEEDGGYTRIAQDSADTDADGGGVAVEAEELLAATGTDDASGGWFAGASFRNSPSAATRAKARNKRKKRRR